MNYSSIKIKELFLLFFSIIISACTTQNYNKYIESPVGLLYNEAMHFLELGDSLTASKIFLEVVRQHPNCIWATKAQLMGAYAAYESGQYENAVIALDRFIQLHPGHKDAAYAYYLKGLCYYERISDVALDQKTALLAADAFQEVIVRFPNSLYARDFQFKMDLILDHLAGKEMAIGRFYMQRQRYPSAINRFRNVVAHYQRTTHVPEALYRLVESYTALGLIDEARKVTAVLGFNFPESLWYQDSYDLMRRYTETESICFKTRMITCNTATQFLHTAIISLHGKRA